MPRAKKEKSPKKEEFVWRGFVDGRMSDPAKEQFRGWACDYATAWGRLLDLLDDGYKLSISAEPEKGFINVSLTGKAGVGANAGYCLVSRARDVETALRLAVFKHDVWLEGDWQLISPREAEDQEFE